MNFLVARAAKHFWEEPVISGTNGSGTIFFGGCVMRCVYCQNHRISRGGKGTSITAEQLIDVMLWLQDEGAHNINFVTPSHYAVPLACVLEKVKGRIKIPVVYNTGGYDRVDDLIRLDGLVDIYLPDFKYSDSGVSQRYSGKPDYFEVASAAIREMRRQQPKDIFYKGLMRRGVIVRHLILPDNTFDSKRVLDFLATVDKKLYISLMSQYFPAVKLARFPELNRRIEQSEYDRVREHFFALGLSKGFMQDLDSAIEGYVPEFDLDSGIMVSTPPLEAEVGVADGVGAEDACHLCRSCQKK